LAFSGGARAAAASTMTEPSDHDPLKEEALRRFAELVTSVGIKRFSSSMGLSTRQVNRILASAQPNPVERLVRALQAAEPDVGDRVLDYICQEMGGHFVRHESMDAARINAIRESAEAIAAISDGQISEFDLREVREAIGALSGLLSPFRPKERGKS
jgi:hypothetical protein